MTAQYREVQHLFAGTMAGMTSTILLHPLDLIKVRMQVHEGSEGVYRSTMQATKSVYQQEGLKGLYAGVTPALLASAISWGKYLCVNSMSSC